MIMLEKNRAGIQLEIIIMQRKCEMCSPNEGLGVGGFGKAKCPPP